MVQLDVATRTDISQYSGKDTLLRVLESEYETALATMLEADEAGWQAQTPCEDWEVRDLAGHFLDVAFCYLGYFELAHKAWPTDPPRGMRVYAEELSTAACAYHELPQHELVARLVPLSERLFAYFHDLDEQQWTGMLVPHKYVGPVPAFMMATFQLMDYTVHNWDFQKALGKPAALNPEAADLLVPFMFGLKGICFDDELASDLDLAVQVDVGGRDGDQWTVTVKDGAYAYVPGTVPDAQAVFAFADPAEFALDAYQRLQGGTAEGDPAVIETFRNLFFTI